MLQISPWTILLLSVGARALSWRGTGGGSAVDGLLPAGVEGSVVGQGPASTGEVGPAHGRPDGGPTLEQTLAALHEASRGAFADDVFASLRLLDPTRLKTDCIDGAAASLTLRCASGADGSSRGNDEWERERLEVAVAMTLCDLASASLPAPLECQRSASRSSSTKGCVQALSRSTQYWSTYSGYLRETNLVCMALKQSRSVDVAHDIYRNATLEKVALLRALRDEDDRRQAFDARFSSSLDMLQTNLVDLASLRAALDDSLAAFRQSVGPDGLKALTREVANRLHDDVDVHVLPRFHAGVDGVLDELRVALRSTADESTRATAAYSSRLERDALSLVARLQSSVDLGAASLESTLEDARGAVVALGRGVRDATTDLETVADMSRQIAEDLERSRETALATEIASSHTLSHLGFLSVALSNLTSLIAQQTDAIAVNLARSGRASTHWLQEGVISGVLRLLRGMGVAAGDAAAPFGALRVVVGTLVAVLAHLLDVLLTISLFVLAWSTRRVRNAVKWLAQDAPTSTSSAVPKAVDIEGLDQAPSLAAPIKPEPPAIRSSRSTVELPLPPAFRPSHPTPPSTPQTPRRLPSAVRPLQMSPLAPLRLRSLGGSSESKAPASTTPKVVDRKTRAASAPL